MQATLSGFFSQPSANKNIDLCHDTLDTEQFGHLLPQRTRTQVCIECPLHWNSQELCVACTVDRVERKWNLKLYLDAIAMHKEWYNVILASDPGRVRMGRVLLEIELRLWWLQERVAFVQMEVERLRELREYQLYFWDANEPKDVVFPPWSSQFAGAKPGTRYDGRNAGYPSYLASRFR
jgi:hypothetical protein